MSFVYMQLYFLSLHVQPLKQKINSFTKLVIKFCHQAIITIFGSATGYTFLYKRAVFQVFGYHPQVYGVVTPEIKKACSCIKTRLFCLKGVWLVQTPFNKDYFCSMVLTLAVTLATTRRFCSRPAAVELSAIGFSLP